MIHQLYFGIPTLIWYTESTMC